MMMSVQKPAFKGYVPVEFYAKHPTNGKYVPVLKEDNIKKCQSFVVRNLNGTLKNQNDKFINFYRERDKDYRMNPVVHSVYDKNNPIVYMVTGSDVDAVKQMAKPLGRAKSESINEYGHTKSSGVYQTGRDYYQQVTSFLKNTCRQLSSPNNEKLSLRVYFDPIYSKKGQLKGFNFVNARFLLKDDK